MTKIKLCGLSRPCDIETANRLLPEYIGFVFAPKSKRYVPPGTAAALKRLLHPSIQAVGVFVREEPEQVARLLRDGIIDIAQLHGGEDAAYVRVLRRLTDRPILQAFRVDSAADVAAAQKSEADMILLDAGAGGTGTAFGWMLLRDIRRPYFLAGGLHPDNVREAMERLSPYAVDVSSGIETDGRKDADKMEAFMRTVRRERA
ncbi:MAG: phosphoribosylanthranilate isomerase [Dysosmobacter sp.]|nr:phosphoribosylanthranilate isomerase [Dysosmobacter sp.]